jgi:hypothetical protein
MDSSHPRVSRHILKVNPRMDHHKGLPSASAATSGAEVIPRNPGMAINLDTLLHKLEDMAHQVSQDTLQLAIMVSLVGMAKCRHSMLRVAMVIHLKVNTVLILRAVMAFIPRKRWILFSSNTDVPQLQAHQ